MSDSEIQDGQHKVIEHVCSICGNTYTGFGNNAQPVNDGRCCDPCNKKQVIPARVALMNLGFNPRGRTKP